MIPRHYVAFLIVACAAVVAEGASTRVTVRAVSRDAKILGDGVGGARISIRDVATGKLLATGIQRGGTGSTKRIMLEPRARGATVYDTDGAAAFRATLDLTRPTRVEITAEGPLRYPQAMQRTSRTMLLLPGAHVEGDGVLLEIPGFIVDTESSLSAEVDQPFRVRAKVVMTCGCPTEPGGLWDADRIRVTARVLRGSSPVEEIVLAYAGESSTYEGQTPPLPPGAYTVEIVASDTGAGNFGRARAKLLVRPAGRARAGR